jgi:predicted amidohydrolase YtcJ
LNVPIAAQPTINLQMGEQPVIGPRLTSMYMLTGSLYREGVIIGGSTDSPVVTCNPFEGMYAAVTRFRADGSKYGPDEVVTPAQA